jgi:hypothetical protein
VTKNRREGLGSSSQLQRFVKCHRLATIILQPPEALELVKLTTRRKACKQAARREVRFYEREDGRGEGGRGRMERKGRR